MNVVVALQSPTLFNQLAISNEWNLWMEPIGNHEKLMEATLPRIPPLGRMDPIPDAVFVCAPSHIEMARRRWPHAKIVWVFHNGFQPLLPDKCNHEIDGAIAFSHRVCRAQSAYHGIKVRYISVAYEPSPRWKWNPDAFWSMRNRPSTRTEDVPMVVSLSMRDQSFTCYGQDQPGGFVDNMRREELVRSCTAYVSCLPRLAGFGLAEHEAMAAGVPVLATPWGDMEEEAPFYPSMARTLEELPRIASDLNINPSMAQYTSTMGLNYIGSCRTVASMDKSIAEFTGSL